MSITDIVVADAFFSTSTFEKGMSELGFYLVSRFRDNACLHYIPKKEKVRLVIWRMPGGKCKLFFSTKLSMTGEEVLKTYHTRFQIEFFRDSKQFMGLMDCQARHNGGKWKLQFCKKKIRLQLSIRRGYRCYQCSNAFGSVYPSSDDSLTIVDRVAFLFGTSDGYFRFTNLCETNKIDIKEIEW